MDWTSEEKVYIWLDSFPLSRKEKSDLLERAGSAGALMKNLDGIFHSVIKEKHFGVYNNMAESLKNAKAFFQKLTDGYLAEKVIPITKLSPLYPEALKKDAAAPLVLYAKGDVSLLNTEAFAVVGSRTTGEKIMRLGKQIAKELSTLFTVITGTADGGDEAAALGAIAGSGKVICVCAGGFSSLPKQSDGFLQDVKKRGLLLAAYPPEMGVRNFSFEERNELIAKLAVGTLVLSAGEKSGALITAKYTAKFQKPLFAIPYPPENEAGKGCNALIKNGAFLTESAEDIFQKLERFPSEAPKDDKTAPTREKREETLTDGEEKIVSVLQAESEISVTALSQKLGVPAFKLGATLTSLEIKGYILRIGGNRIAYAKNTRQA